MSGAVDATLALALGGHWAHGGGPWALAPRKRAARSVPGAVEAGVAAAVEGVRDGAVHARAAAGGAAADGPVAAAAGPLTMDAARPAALDALTVARRAMADGPGAAVAPATVWQASAARGAVFGELLAAGGPGDAAGWAPPQTIAAAMDGAGAVAPAAAGFAAMPMTSGGFAPPLPSVAPPVAAGGSGLTGGDVLLDGTRMGRWVADHLARAAGRPQASSTAFDPSLSPRWPGTLQGG